jgi:beta-galactosidase
MIARFLGGGSALFTLRQEGTRLTGTVEGGAGFFSGFALIPVEDGKVEGAKVSFRAGIFGYSGKLTADRIELKRTLHIPFHLVNARPNPNEKRPAIGPPPDGTDPSRSAGFRRGPDAIVLLRVRW